MTLAPILVVPDTLKFTTPEIVPLITELPVIVKELVPPAIVEELVIIAKMMLEEQQYQLTPQAEIALTDYITRRKQKPLFANARSIKNALDRARMRQANRIFDSRGQVLTKKELVNIEADDILQSTIFN